MWRGSKPSSSQAATTSGRTGRASSSSTTAARLRPAISFRAAEYVERIEEIEAGGEAALQGERERTERLLEAVADLSDERVRERAVLLAKMLTGSDRPVSFNDPDARWGHKGSDKPFCCYKAREAINPESWIITAVEVVPGNANGALRTDMLLERETTTLEEGAAIIGDGLYNNAVTIGQVEEVGGRPCFSGLRAERISNSFSYDAVTDQMVCIRGCRSIGKTRVKRGDLHYFSMTDCQEYPQRGGV
jgi:hypothetical protein